MLRTILVLWSAVSMLLSCSTFLYSWNKLNCLGVEGYSILLDDWLVSDSSGMSSVSNPSPPDLEYA